MEIVQDNAVGIQDIENKIRALSPEQKEVNLKSVAYIKNLANSYKADISGWNLLEIFGDPTNQPNLLVDKKLINKAFVAKLQKAKEAITLARNEVELEFDYQGFSAAVRDSYKEITNKQIKAHKENIRYLMADLKALQDSVVQKMQQIQKEQTKINDFENKNEKAPKEDKLISEIKEIIAQKIWVNPVFENGCLYLNTANDIVIKDTRTKENINMGQYAIRIDFNNDLYMNLIPYRNNYFLPRGTHAKNQYHPHVLDGARICWGEATTNASQLLQKAEIGKVLTLLFAMLGNYTDTGGYTSPSEFAKNGKKDIPLDGIFVHPNFRNKK